jgi:hypothetical protein
MILDKGAGNENESHPVMECRVVAKSCCTALLADKLNKEVVMIEKYIHHGVLVSVQSDLKGKHRDHCLCHKCEHFSPNTLANCNMAQELFELCVKYNLTTPVYECPEFELKEK